jgi:hypothetical protein
MSESTEKKAKSILTKTKYKNFEESLKQYLAENESTNVDKMKTEILDLLCDIMKFDPALSTYDKEKIAKLREQTGKNTYELFRRKYYETHKEELDKKMAENARKARTEKKTAIA